MRLTHLRVRYAGPADAGPRGAALAAWIATTLAPPVAPPGWRPPCDLTESARAWTLQAELAGVDEDALELLLYEDSLVVQGVRPWRGAPETLRVHLAEIRYGPFRLALELPGGVDRATARAAYERGVLTVVLPKQEAP